MPASESPVVEIPQYSNAPHSIPVQRLTSSADYYTANLAVAVPAHQSAFENYLKKRYRWSQTRTTGGCYNGLGIASLPTKRHRVLEPGGCSAVRIGYSAATAAMHTLHMSVQLSQLFKAEAYGITYIAKNGRSKSDQDISRMRVLR